MPAKKPETEGQAAKPTRKPAAAKAVTAKTAPAKTAAEKLATAPAAKAASADAPAKATNVIRLKDLIAAVAKTTGSKNKAHRAVIEATLTEIGSALADGSVVNLPGLGKAQVSRRMDKAAGGEMLIIKLRRLAAGADKPVGRAKQALANDGEDS